MKKNDSQSNGFFPLGVKTEYFPRERISIPSSDLNSHTLIAGSPGAGKSAHLTRLLANYDKAMIVVDQRGEPYKSTCELREKYGPVYRWPPIGQEKECLDSSGFIEGIPSNWIEQNGTVYILYDASLFWTQNPYSTRLVVQKQVAQIIEGLMESHTSEHPLLCAIDQLEDVRLPQLPTYLKKKNQNNVWFALYVQSTDQLGGKDYNDEYRYDEDDRDLILQRCENKIWFWSQLEVIDRSPVAHLKLHQLYFPEVIIQQKDVTIRAYSCYLEEEQHVQMLKEREDRYIRERNEYEASSKLTTTIKNSKQIFRLGNFAWVKIINK